MHTTKRIDDATKQMARNIWASMSKNDRHGVRFGLFPAATMEVAEKAGYDTRAISLVLLDLAEQKEL